MNDSAQDHESPRPAPAIRIRRGTPHDAPRVLEMLDGAVAWMNARGNTEQWGTTPYSQTNGGADRVQGYFRDNDPFVAELDGTPVGALVLDTGPNPKVPAIPRADEPERYVRLLITDRRHAGHGIGAALLAHAVEVTRRAGVDLLRVDCWAGGDGALVAYYERNGFRSTTRFQVGSWPGRVLERRVNRAASVIN
ncbi:GNAT family N-acetyltransferase [Streptomyces triticagri]|uniref:GNAT family N-acetyltransferase n=1 Tax=Streptomyces triticagri TaxID=2293568 RepID=UPI00389989DD